MLFKHSLGQKNNNKKNVYISDGEIRLITQWSDPIRSILKGQIFTVIYTHSEEPVGNQDVVNKDAA